MREDLIERLRAVEWEETDDCGRMPDDPAAKCVFVDMRPDDFRALLREAADALEAAREDGAEAKQNGYELGLLAAAREDACVSLVADIRLACGDNGKRMQPELVEYIRGLAADAERYRWLRKGANRGANDDIAVVRGLGAMDYGMSAVLYTYSEEIDGDALDAAIDQARGEENGND